MVKMRVLAVGLGVFSMGSVAFGQDEPPPVAEVGRTETTDGEPPPVAEVERDAATEEAPSSAASSGQLASAAGSEPEAPPERKPPTAFAPAAQAGDVLSTIGLHINAGFAGGGDSLAQVTYTDGSTSSLDAGEGVYVGGGITWTPLWPTDRLGFGLGYEVGYKLGTTGANADGAIEMERIPMVLSLRGLVAIAANYHFVLAVGGVGEFGPKMYGTGVATGFDQSFPDALGGMAEAGILFGAPLSVGGELGGRFTFIEYDFMGTKFSAMSGSFNARLHFFL